MAPCGGKVASYSRQCRCGRQLRPIFGVICVALLVLGVHRWDEHNCLMREREQRGVVESEKMANADRHGQYSRQAKVDRGGFTPAPRQQLKPRYKVAVLVASISPQAARSGLEHPDAVRSSSTWLRLMDSSLISTMISSLAQTVEQHETQTFDITLYCAFDEDDQFWRKYAAELQVSRPRAGWLLCAAKYRTVSTTLTSGSAMCGVSRRPICFQNGLRSM